MLQDHSTAADLDMLGPSFNVCSCTLLPLPPSASYCCCLVSFDPLSGINCCLGFFSSIGILKLAWDFILNADIAAVGAKS